MLLSVWFVSQESRARNQEAMRGEEAKLLEQERATMERRVKHQIQVSLQACLANAGAR